MLQGFKRGQNAADLGSVVAGARLMASRRHVAPDIEARVRGRTCWSRDVYFLAEADDNSRETSRTAWVSHGSRAVSVDLHGRAHPKSTPGVGSSFERLADGTHRNRPLRRFVGAEFYKKHVRLPGLGSVVNICQ